MKNIRTIKRYSRVFSTDDAKRINERRAVKGYKRLSWIERTGLIKDILVGDLVKL